jgi:hypothetical protein
VEIEIITTKKKLTKSILQQMPTAPVDIMKVADVLGYYTDSKLGKVALLTHNQEYYTRPLSYTTNANVPTKVFRGVCAFVEFDNVQDRDDWWDVYTKVRGEALKTHIYI